MIYLYSLFHKPLPKSSLQIHWISVRFYEMGDILVREAEKKSSHYMFVARQIRK